MNDPKPRICHFSSVHPVVDNRVFYKECVGLARAGYDTCLIVRDNQPPRISKNVYIIPFHPAKSRLKRLFLVVPKMLSLTLRQKARVYHFHDPELIPVGVILKLLGKKVVYDVHEDVPKQIMSKEWIKSFLLRRIASVFATLFEKTGQWFFDAVVAATPDIARKFNPQKTVVIHNYPILGHISSVAAITPEHPVVKPVVIYAGKITLHRGVRELVDAASLVKNPVEIWLLGKYEEEAYWREIQHSPGWKHVRYFGVQPPEIVYTYMKAAQIGVSTLYPIENYLTGLPVKAFEYMACGLPMIMSGFPFWRELFGEYALFADPKSPAEIAAQIDILTGDPVLREKLAAQGRRAVLEQFSWEREEQTLVNLYKKLTTAKS